MKFPTPLVQARLLRRYKRFLSDIELPDGSVHVAHCPNPGSMMGLAEPGSLVWVEPNDDPRKKLKFGWRLAELAGGHLACVDTGLANRVVAEALAARAIPALAGYGTHRAEVRFGEKSRVDFLLTEAGRPDAYVEVKSVTLCREADWAEFPDSVTARGARHLEDLARMVADGHRAVMLYLIQRTDCARFRLAADLDPAYAEAFARATAEGVEVLCHEAQITPDGLHIGGALEAQGSD
ncbi:MAG: DNA/RNA nuclease SfsA [Alphaproteobacteria bacterium]|nr:DNA/RNA nuclease SfsA [Alphaproteobacteria bacterium]NNF24763.1 DNA/RNA nuclease SfsA [Paracoccaceae bacterium]